MKSFNLKFTAIIFSFVVFLLLALKATDTIHRTLFVALAVVFMALVYQQLTAFGRHKDV